MVGEEKGEGGRERRKEGWREGGRRGREGGGRARRRVGRLKGGRQQEGGCRYHSYQNRTRPPLRSRIGPLFGLVSKDLNA